MLLVFTGPTATGKTTRIRLVCRQYSAKGFKCFNDISEPFGGFSYIYLIILSKIILFAYRPGGFLRGKSSLALLEIVNPVLLSKHLRILILLDTINIIFRYIIYRLLMMLKFKILVEDFAPQALSDHVAYATLYNKKINKLIYYEFKIFRGLLKRNTICIHLVSHEDTRIGREAARGGRLDRAVGFYNRYVRDRLVSAASGYMCKMVYRWYIVENGNQG